MNLLKLKNKVDEAFKSAVRYGYEPPENIQVHVQIDDMQGASVFSDDVEIHYDNNSMASGCVIVGTVKTIKDMS